MVSRLIFENGLICIVTDVHTAEKRRCAFTAVAVSKGFRVGSVVEGEPGYYYLEEEPIFSSVEEAQTRADSWNERFEISAADVWHVVASAMEESLKHPDSTWSLRRAP
jgi:hypothetical protein